MEKAQIDHEYKNAEQGKGLEAEIAYLRQRYPGVLIHDDEVQSEEAPVAFVVMLQIQDFAPKVYTHQTLSGAVWHAANIHHDHSSEAKTPGYVSITIDIMDDDVPGIELLKWSFDEPFDMMHLAQ